MAFHSHNIEAAPTLQACAQNSSTTFSGIAAGAKGWPDGCGLEVCVEHPWIETNDDTGFRFFLLFPLRVTLNPTRYAIEPARRATAYSCVALCSWVLKLWSRMRTARVDRPSKASSCMSIECLLARCMTRHDSANVNVSNVLTQVSL